MQQRDRAVFVGDKYCSYSGNALEDAPQLKHLDDIAPDAFATLKTAYENAWTVTGRVTSSYLYKRNYSSSNANLTHSFWWIALCDKNDQLHQFSLNAESRVFENIKKGDVLSVVFPTSLTLTHQIMGREAKARVTDDTKVPAAVVHRDENQQYNIDSWFTPSDRPKSYWFVLTFILAMFGFGSVLGAGPEMLGGALLVAFVTFLLEYVANGNKHEKQLEKHATLTGAMDAFLNVTKKQLGFHLAAREHMPSDIFCHRCEERIASDSVFCASCGSQQNTDSSRVQTTNVAAIESDLLGQFHVDYSEAYTHKRVLGKDQDCEVNVSCMLAKVVSRDTSSNVSDVTTTKTTTRSYDVYHGNRYQRTETETSVSSNRLRQSKMTGKLVIKLANDEIREQGFAEDIIGGLDEGDWFIYARADAQFPVSSHNREYAYNLSQNHHFTTSTFKSYSGPSAIAKWVILLVLFLGGNWLWSANALDILIQFQEYAFAEELSYYMPIVENIPLIVFALLNVYWFVRTLAVSAQNRKARESILSRLSDTLKQFEIELPQLQEKIKRIS
tara:strand:- start:50 stop:1717 length:1668 start_codon:yes stop_codon:yes gene_type:complete